MERELDKSKLHCTIKSRISHRARSVALYVQNMVVIIVILGWQCFFLVIGPENSRCLPDSTYQMQHKAWRDMVNSFSRALQVVCLIFLWLLIGSFQHFSCLRRSDSSLHRLSSFSSLSHNFLLFPPKLISLLLASQPSLEKWSSMRYCYI